MKPHPPRRPIRPMSPRSTPSLPPRTDVISGPAGQKRDWNRERSLFIPGARLIPTSKRAGVNKIDNEGGPDVLDVEGYIARVEPYFQEQGFFEKEIARRTEQFGNIAHVWSTYESRYSPDDPQPFMRGINSIQLIYREGRWWIVTIYWQHESADQPIPAEYLKTIFDRVDVDEQGE